MFLRFILTIFTMMFLCACSWLYEFPVASADLSTQMGEVITLRGEVIGSIDDCAFDGICAAVVASDRGEINIIWTNGMMQCLGEFSENLPSGSQIEARGEVVDSTSITICTNESYYLRLQN